MNNEQLTEGPILNRLNTLQEDTTIQIESAGYFELSKTRKGRLNNFFPNAEGPLNISLKHENGEGGILIFAGEFEGITRITVVDGEKQGMIVFDNPRIPTDGYLPPFREFSGFDEHDNLVVDRQVAMGLYDSPKALRAARDAASE